MIATFLVAAQGLLPRLISLSGLLVMIGLAWLWSAAAGRHRLIRWRVVLWGVLLQLAFGVVVLSPAVQDSLFRGVDAGVGRLLSFAEAGANFAFQAVVPHQILDAGGQAQTYVGVMSPAMKTLSTWVLPSIIFFSTVMAILYHLGVMQKVVYGLAWVMQRTLGTSGAETLSAAANIFVGQTEAPLLVAPFVDRMTRSELHAVMTAGFATVAGGVMAVYVRVLQDIPGIAGHLVTASILSAPAALAISKIMMPEDGQPETLGLLSLDVPRPDRNVLEAAARGATEGMRLTLNVVAMLIAFVGLLAMLDWGLSFIPFAGEPLSMSRILGWIFSPLAFAMGVPWSEAGVVGTLLGEKLVVTELIAYIHLGEIVHADTPVLSERSAIIASYALCGFANFASIGIQLGGIGGIAPRRMGDLAEIGLSAMVAGSLAAFMTATVAGALL